MKFIGNHLKKQAQSNRPIHKDSKDGTIYFGSIMKKKLITLTVVGVLAVLSQVMLVEELLLHGSE